MGRPLREALAALAERAARGVPPASTAVGLRWLRDIQCADPGLFDLIFEIQDRSYRRNRFIRDRVWTYEAFQQRSVDYVVFGPLPRIAAGGRGGR